MPIESSNTWGSTFTSEISEDTEYQLASGIACTKNSNVIVEQSCILGNKLNIKVLNEDEFSKLINK